MNDQQLHALFATQYRAKHQLERWERIRRPDYWTDRYGELANPPPQRLREVWDKIVAWKQAWVDYGKSLQQQVYGDEEPLVLFNDGVTAAVSRPTRGEIKHG